ncbi:MAG: hypothetical protein WBA61_01045 [Aequorivita sp.]
MNVALFVVERSTLCFEHRTLCFEGGVAVGSGSWQWQLAVFSWQYSVFSVQCSVGSVQLAVAVAGWGFTQGARRGRGVRGGVVVWVLEFGTWNLVLGDWLIR